MACVCLLSKCDRHVVLSSTDSSEHLPPLSSCDLSDSQLLWNIGWPPPKTLSIFSVLPERVLLMQPFGSKPHLFVNYAINKNKIEEAFMVSLPRARDVSWHHHACDDWWNLSGCISCSATLGENRVVIKRWLRAWLRFLNNPHRRQQWNT